MVDGRPVRLGLWDTAGQEEYDRLRPLSYAGVHALMVCFSATEPSSFRNVRSKWVPEVRHHCPTVPIVLVGTKGDLRSDEEVQAGLRAKDAEAVSMAEVQAYALEIGASVVVECSALTQMNLKSAFDDTIRVGLAHARALKGERDTGGGRAWGGAGSALQGRCTLL